MQLYYFPLLLLLIFSMAETAATTPQNTLDRIKSNAIRDDINLSVLPFAEEALISITQISIGAANNSLPDFKSAIRIDTHTHPIPSWFRVLELSAAGRETPNWDAFSHLQFMAERGIKRSILSVSTPQANAFASPSNFEPDKNVRKCKTIALARLLNEFIAELCRVYPQQFSFLAVTALPYVAESIVEVRYALEELDAVGISVLTNAEGVYPGDVAFEGLWQYLEERAKTEDGREIVFVHPTDPLIKLEDGRLISSRPCKS
jgi:hypothetical protein